MISIEKLRQISINIYLNVSSFGSRKHSIILINRSLLGVGEIDESLSIDTVDLFFFILRGRRSL